MNNVNDFIGSVAVAIIFGILARIQKNKDKKREQEIKNVDYKVYKIDTKILETKEKLSEIDSRILVVHNQVHDHKPDIDWLKKEDSYIREEMINMKKDIFIAMEKRNDLQVKLSELERYKNRLERTAFNMYKQLRVLEKTVETLVKK